ncbi:hypothetical protein D3C86_1323160 [compost metagenome]
MDDGIPFKTLSAGFEDRDLFSRRQKVKRNGQPNKTKERSEVKQDDLYARNPVFSQCDRVQIKKNSMQYRKRQDQSQKPGIFKIQCRKPGIMQCKVQSNHSKPGSKDVIRRLLFLLEQKKQQQKTCNTETGYEKHKLMQSEKFKM